MTTLESIVIYLRPDAVRTDVSSTGEVSFSKHAYRTKGRFDEFAELLGTLLRVPTSVMDEPPLIPASGTIVACTAPFYDWETTGEWPESLWAEKGRTAFSWMLGFYLDGALVLNAAESLGLAAAIDIVDYWTWEDNAPVPVGIYGRRELAPRIGATGEGGRGSAPRYFRMVRGDNNLPLLLADYLRAYAEAGFLTS